VAQAPRTFPGILLLFGWSLFVLVLVNSYAANLVTIIIKEEPARFLVDNMQQAVDRKLKTCVWESSSAGEVTKSMFPTMRKVKTTGANEFTMLRNDGLSALPSPTSPSPNRDFALQ
jgi:hypothetical protein